MIKAHNRIEMEDRECSPELLQKLYLVENRTLNYIKKYFNVSENVLNRWFIESKINKREDKGIYNFNKNYFDEIYTEEKAYWIGFIWCDGYVCQRTRKGIKSYEFKLDLAIVDKNHVEKFKKALNSTHPIKEYSYKNHFSGNENSQIARIYLSNNYFAGNLVKSYGLIANRNNTNKLINKIPQNLYRHFIRGALDADGSISNYYIEDTQTGKTTRKMSVRFFTNIDLLEFIKNHFYIMGLTEYSQTFRKRHEGRDGNAAELQYTGNKQVPLILNYLYENSTVNLERKKEIYQEIVRV